MNRRSFFYNVHCDRQMNKKKKPTRKEREQEQRKQYILSCAEVLFADNGYDNTSMAMIAERSEFSVGTVYNFFQSKNDIYSSLLIGKLTEVYEGLSLIAKKVIKPLEKIREIIEFNMDMIHKNEKFLMLYMNDVARHEWGLVSNIETSDEGLHSKISKLTEKVIHDAQLDVSLRNDISSKKALYIFKKLITVYLLDAIACSDKFDAQKSVNEMYDIFLHGVGAKK